MPSLCSGIKLYTCKTNFFLPSCIILYYWSYPILMHLCSCSVITSALCKALWDPWQFKNPTWRDSIVLDCQYPYHWENWYRLRHNKRVITNPAVCFVQIIPTANLLWKMQLLFHYCLLLFIQNTRNTFFFLVEKYTFNRKKYVYKYFEEWGYLNFFSRKFFLIWNTKII